MINNKQKIKDALVSLNNLNGDKILFIVNSQNKIIGSLTDGDIRRGFINGFKLEDFVGCISNKNPLTINKNEYKLEDIKKIMLQKIKTLPVVENNEIINIIDLSILKSYLPIDVVIMAGGKGSRLKPLTNNIPKPLLKVADKAIIDHVIERLTLFGIDDFWISVNYLKEQIINYLGSGKNKHLNFNFVSEDSEMGTIGSVSTIQNFKHEYVIIMNSDVLTNLDYEDFLNDFINQNAEMSVVTIPYRVNIPYGIIESKKRLINNLVEKPTYTYYSNAGIYLLKKEVLKNIPLNTFFNATDLIELLIKNNNKVISYPFSGYWLDIGKPSDYEKSQKDIYKIDFK